MKRFALREENKKYKTISIQSNDISETNKKLRIVSSIKRISNQSNEFLTDLSKISTYKVHEKINLITEEIINLFYDMELAILSEGSIPLITGKKLITLKAALTLCKIQLCMPGLNEICFPESFKEEYSLLLERTNKAILAVKTRIDKVKTMEGFDPLKDVIEKNLLRLNMLRMHYITALGLPKTN